VAKAHAVDGGVDPGAAAGLGLVDALANAKILAFGPNKSAARL
jgi:phosphoribosylamine-glycine ligase